MRFDFNLVKAMRNILMGFMLVVLAGCAASEITDKESAAVKTDDSIQAKSVKKFPREIRLPQSRLIVYQPQIEEWRDHKTLVGWAAVLIKPDSGKDTITGAIKFSAETDVDNEARTVVAYNRKLLEVNFPTLSQNEINSFKRNIQNAVTKAPELIPLDMLLAAMANKDAQLKSIDVSVMPPKIFYSDAPAILVLFDGKPLFAKIENTSLKFAINTNWDIFLDESNTTYYLRHGKQWLVASDYKEGWLATTKLPEDIAKLPKEKNWDAVHQSIPPLDITKASSVSVKVSDEPAELIVTEGKPKLVAIKNIKLSYVENTNNDLFYHGETSEYYILVSGRWFKTKDLNGQWVYSEKLPEGFSKIPADHVKADVRASIPGTVEAKLAVLQAQVPHKATVDISNTQAKVDYAGEPVFKPIKGTTLKYAVNTSSDVIQAGASFYLCNKGVWFVANSPRGPWKVATVVPDEIYDIPSDSPLYHVTYVYIYDYTPSTVTVGYTAGYHNMYVSYGVVMYGTGYYYNPYWYTYPTYPYYPIYYPYYPSYGVAAYYNPYTGTYGRGAYYYGPYGGYGRGASYNPATGRYARSATAWGPTDGIYARQAYNPSTGIYSESIQSANTYSHWGNSVVRHGQDWIKTSHYTDEKGTRRTVETSKGGKGAQFKGDDHSAGAIKNKEGDLFVGKDGAVFKRTEDGWHKRDGQNWTPVEKTIDVPLAKDKLKEKGVTKESVKENIQNQGITRESAKESISTRRTEKGSGRSYEQRKSTQSNIDQLNRDARSRSYGNQRHDEFRSRQQSGNLYNRGSSYNQRNFNAPRQTMPGNIPSRPVGGGRFRR